MWKLICTLFAIAWPLAKHEFFTSRPAPNLRTSSPKDSPRRCSKISGVPRFPDRIHPLTTTIGSLSSVNYNFLLCYCYVFQMRSVSTYVEGNCPRVACYGDTGGCPTPPEAPP